MSERLDVSRIIAMLEQGLTEGNVAYELGSNPWAVKLALAAAGYKRPSKARPRASRPFDDAELIDLARSQSLRQLAKHFGCSVTRVRNRLIALGVERREMRGGVLMRVDGGDCKRVILTPKKVVAMRAANRDGVSQAERARMFGVSRTAARKASDGETWGHVPVLVCTNVGGTNAQ